jgi:AcrR family transcriptional regulator/DNA-binding MarR family transcriptional regulator
VLGGWLVSAVALGSVHTAGSATLGAARSGRVRLAPVAGESQREQVVDVQRRRMLGAMTRAVGEVGAANVTVGHVVARAGVSRRTFYELFADCEQCLLEAIEDAIECARERILATYDPQESWLVRVRSALVALLGLFDEQPAVGRLLIVESLAAGPAALELRRRALVPLVATVEQGREHSSKGTWAPSLAGEGVVGGVLGLLHARLSDPDAGDREPVSGLSNQLMSMIVLPYLGPAGARRELKHAMPAPPPAMTMPAPEVDPFKGAGMRLTYRTMLVLEVIEHDPASSNRRIAQIAGVTDQGQISKLLGRLERLGLIENNQPESHLKGEPNAWTLTSTGAQVVHALRAQSTRPSTPGEHHDRQPARAPRQASDARSEQPAPRTAKKQTKRGRR